GQVLLMYQIGKELGGKSLGITVAILAALAGYLVDTVTSLSNPNPIHFLSALALWLFLKALKPKASNWWLFSLGFVLGVGFFKHYQMLAYLILFVCIFVVKKFSLRYLFWTGLGVFISYLPMLYFDLLNQLHMLRIII